MSAYDRVFVDIDTQFDFMDPTGRLYVPGAERVVPALRRLFAFATEAGIPVLSSADDHEPGDPEFEQFGPHCLRGTPGQAKIDATTLPRAAIVRPDDEPPDATALLADHDQLVFTKCVLDVFSNPHFGAVVDALAGAEFVVFGVAMEYCVRDAARGLADRGRRVNIVEDGVRAISADAGRDTRRELADAGVSWVPADEVVGAAV